MNSPRSRLLQKRLYTIKEAAIYLGRSEDAIRELEWNGDLPSVRKGRRIHFDIYDLDLWIEKYKKKNVLK